MTGICSGAGAAWGGAAPGTAEGAAGVPFCATTSGERKDASRATAKIPQQAAADIGEPWPSRGCRRGIAEIVLFPITHPSLIRFTSPGESGLEPASSMRLPLYPTV